MPDADETNIASHTLNYLRFLDRKVDLLIEVMQRNGGRLGRLERNVAEVKCDIILLDNKAATVQMEILGPEE